MNIASKECLKPPLTGVDLRRGWLLVNAAFAAFLKFEMLDRVRYISSGAINAGLFESLVEDAAGGSHEWPPFQVFVVSWLLAIQNNTRGRGPLAEDRLSGMQVEVASFAALRGIAKHR